MSEDFVSVAKGKQQTAQELDRWVDEGGSLASVASEARRAQIDRLPVEEQRILQCLGAAVVVRWSELPTDVQRILFRSASVTDRSGAADELPGQIARFLHDHGDEGRTW